jgi:hypothetical protein
VSVATVSAAPEPAASNARPSAAYDTLAMAWVAMAPTPRRAAGTTEPTAMNLLATATPKASPVRATIEKVMPATLATECVRGR